MGRTAGFTDEHVFGWLAGHLSQSASVTVIEVSQGTGVSVGSIYHRYGSMDALLARAWLWAVGRHQAPLYALLKGEGLQTGIQAALHTVRFARTDPAAALIIACCPRSAFVKAELQETLSLEIIRTDRRFGRLLADFAGRSDFAVVSTELAMIRFPIAVAQMYLPQKEVPRDAEIYVKKAFRATVRLQNAIVPEG